VGKFPFFSLHSRTNSIELREGEKRNKNPLNVANHGQAYKRKRTRPLATKWIQELILFLYFFVISGLARQS